MKNNPILYFSISIVILILIGGLSVDTTVKLLKLENRTSKTFELSQVFEQTLTSTQKAQLAVRNYIISGNTIELQNRDLAIKQYNDSNKKLQKEVKDPYLLAYLNTLNGLRKNRIEEYKVDYSTMRKEKGVAYSLSYFTKLVNYKVYLTEIPKLISKYKARQTELENEYKARIESEARFVLFIIIIGSIISVLIAVYAVLIIRKDIAIRKKNELQLIDFAKKLKNRNTQLFDFSSIVSHNLRAPLVNILMLSEFLEDAEDEEERKEVVTKMKKVTSHINEIFSELVDTLQILEDIEVKSDTIEFDACLKAIILDLEILIKSEEATVEFDFSEAPILYFPKKYIESILLNLLTNAIRYKYPDRKPIIQFKTQKLNSSILLSVSDNGLGIDLELHKERLFKLRQVFHNHSDAKGLGLFMTKTQVTSMGGEIWLESEINKGSTFYVEFKNQDNEKS